MGILEEREAVMMVHGKLSSVISELQKKSMWIFIVPFFTSGKSLNICLRHHTHNLSEVHLKYCTMDAESEQNVSVSTRLYVTGP